MDMDFGGKHALVCGSTQGIGKATAIELARRGAAVTLLARNAERLQAVRAELPVIGGAQHGTLCADFDHPEELRALVQDFATPAQPVHILINNTGGPPGGPIADAETAEFDLAFRRHLLCNHILAQAVLPGMRAAGYGRIVNIISTSVKQPIPGLGVSNTVRAAVANWAKTLSREVAPYGITVNNVLPGATQTARLDSIVEKQAQKAGIPLAEAEERLRADIPARRFAEAWEVAIAAVFLASPLAGYINGINIPVDGGRTACL